jgi:NitT/TauT family transport system substrate-binding protein
MRAVLQEHGLAPDKDVTMIGTGGDVEQAAALKAGSADATVVSAGSKHLMKVANAHMLQRSEDITVPMQTNGLAMSRTFLDEHPDVARKVVRALMRAAAAMHDPTQEAAVKRAFERGIGEHDPGALQEWWTYVSSDPDRVFPVTGEIDREGVENVLKLVAQTEPKAADLTFDDVIDESLIKSEAGFAASLGPN